MHYETLLKEEGKTIKDLPQAIKMKINFLNGDLKKLQANPTDAKLKEKVGSNDVLIADAIQTWLEKDLPPIAKVDDAAKIKADAEAKAATEEAERLKNATAEADALKAKEKADAIAEQNATTELQNTIVAKMNASSGRYILKTELATILGRDVKDNENVGQLNLCQVYLSYPVHYKHYK